MYFPLDKDLDEAFKGFIDMRKQIKKPMTARAVDMMMNKINAMGTTTRLSTALTKAHCIAGRPYIPNVEKPVPNPKRAETRSWTFTTR